MASREASLPVVWANGAPAVRGTSCSTNGSTSNSTNVDSVNDINACQDSMSKGRGTESQPNGTPERRIPSSRSPSIPIQHALPTTVSATDSRTRGAASRSVSTPMPSAAPMAASPSGVQAHAGSKLSNSTRPTAALPTPGSASAGRPSAVSATSARSTGDFNGKCSTGLSFDVVKFMKEVMRRRDESVLLRSMPRSQLLQQLLLQEQGAREQLVDQEHSGRITIEHRKKEDRLKKDEQKANEGRRRRLEEMKKAHQDALARQKEAVALNAKQTEAEIREKLQLVHLVQPRLNVVGAAIADVKVETSDCSLLAALMEEDKRLSKQLKADARFNNTKTAAVDGGAVPYWQKACVAASFNVAAIMKGSPYRAHVEDNAHVVTKTPAFKKVVVVKNGAGKTVAWAHTRTGPNVVALAEGLANLPVLTTVEGAAQGTVWLKEDMAELGRRGKTPQCPFAAIVPLCTSTLTYDGVSSFEFTKKDIDAIGRAGAAAS